MATETITSATAMTFKAISTALDNIEHSNTKSQAKQLRILNLEKQLLQQKETANEIINHIQKLNKLTRKSFKVDDLSKKSLYLYS
jgi:hypothetical protein